MPEPRTILFAGPTFFGVEDLDRLPDGWRRWPPAQRGDVLAALGEEPDRLILIDGYFFSVPAVTHKEILYALDAGVEVIGAASMGALRAAELAPYGMRGVGEIFARYRDGAIEGDDEVAVLHLGAEAAYRPTTVALVDLRWALAEMTTRDGPGRAGADALIEAVQELPFGERTEERTLALARSHLGIERGERLRRALAGPSRKLIDAREALAVAARPPAPKPPRGRRLTSFVGAFLEQAARPAAEAPKAAPTFNDAWAVARVLHPEAADFVHAVRERWLLAQAAMLAGLAPDPRAIREVGDALARQLRSTLGRCPLPATERADEAHSLLAADRARREIGVADACRLVAERYGLGRGGEPDRREVDGGEPWPDGSLLPIPAWRTLRAFLSSPALEPALATAAAAREIVRCFDRWSNHTGVHDDELVETAAGLWRCPLAAVPTEAARRGLRLDERLAPGFRSALTLCGVAERLPRPLNDYPQHKARLLAAPLAPLDGELVAPSRGIGEHGATTRRQPAEPTP